MNLPHDTELEGLIIGSVLMKKKLSPFEKGIAVTEFFSLLNQQIWDQRVITKIQSMVLRT